MDIGVLELCGILGALSAGLGGPVAVIRWCGSYVDKKIEESDRAQDMKLDAQAHKLANAVSRIDAIEHLRTSDIERIVKVESAVQNFDKAIERVERGQDKLTDTINDRFDTLAESIREIRTVSPKG